MEFKVKFFTFKKLFDAFCILAARYFSKHFPDEKEFCITKEAFFILLNTSQEHYKEELRKLADVDLHGIKCMSLRLASKDAKEIFNANQLPTLDSKDDIVQKLIREYHKVRINLCRITHFNKKITQCGVYFKPAVLLTLTYP